MRLSALLILIIFLGLGPLQAENLRSLSDSLNHHPPELIYKIDMNNDSVPLVYGTIYFAQGTLYLSADDSSICSSAFYTGEGIFVYRPPDKVEEQQVRRFYKADSAVVRFDRIYFAFPGQSDLLSRFGDKAGKGKPDSRANIEYNQIIKIPQTAMNYNLYMDIYIASLEGQDDFLWVNMAGQNQHSIYIYNPYEREPVSLYLYTARFSSPQLVSSAENDSTAASFRHEYDLYQYDINADISTWAKSKISCRMAMVIGSDSLKILKFTYPAEYGVDSVKDIAGNSLDYLKEKNRPVLTVELPEYFLKGDTASVTVTYRTNLFYHMMNYGVVQGNLVQWYPHCGYRHLSLFDVRYSIDKGYGFLSVGDRVGDTLIDDKHIMEYQTAQPVTYLSFNYGIFDTLTVPDGVVPITIYSLSRAHGGKIFGGGNAERVAEDIAGSTKFYSENYAKYPFGRLEVDDMTVTFGQGSPGLVHLSGRTFDKSYHGVDDLFRAHEVAHQWWGHLVVPETYHEAWLSEGMAEYSAMMYIQLVKNEEKEFRELIKEWKKTIVSRGMTVFGLSDGYKAGPIVLGTRLRNELSPADYNIVVYYKAAYMLHMLRFELDGTGKGHGKFLQLMRAFAEGNAGKLTSTEDFIESARNFLGDRTDQFFDQWLYGWKVPRIEKQFKYEDDGSVTININVNDVDNGFETSYPVKLNLSNDSSVIVIYRIRLGENQLRFQPKPQLSVKGVEFNPDNDILEQ